MTVPVYRLSSIIHGDRGFVERELVMPLPPALKHEMKQKSLRGVKKGGKKPVVRQSRKHDPIPPRWWKSAGRGRDRGDDRAWLDW
jgi:hypothetical protein